MQRTTGEDGDGAKRGKKENAQTAKINVAQLAEIVSTPRMDKKTIKQLLASFTIRHISFELGVSPRTVQGWKYGRKPSPFLRSSINRLLSK